VVLRKVKASGGQIEMRMGMRATIQRVTSSTSLSSATVEEACTSNGQSRALGDPLINIPRGWQKSALLRVQSDGSRMG